MSHRRHYWIAFAWGLAEATFFFLVPDVFLSWLALDRAKPALAACGFALAGALLGGSFMLAWGHADPDTVRSALDRVPAIGPSMIAEVGEELAEHGSAALYIGPTQGVPYKIYAVEWGARGGSPVVFLLQSIPARGLRFAFAVMVAFFIQRFAMKKSTLARKRTVHAVIWASFYAWYFWVMG